MWFLPLVLCVVADAHSVGLYLSSDTGACDFDHDTHLWGCQTNTWNASANFLPMFIRGFCMDPEGNGNATDPKFMWWVGAPKSAGGQFTLRTGDGSPAADPTMYVPGAYLPIYIRQTVFDTPFKGLLLYAKDSSGAKTGTWVVDYEASPDFGVYPLIVCKNSVMHINAEDKHIVNRFLLVTPPKGSGTITIHAMLKTGAPNPTNYGDFLLLPQLTLTEDTSTTIPPGRWAPSSGSQTCAQYCTSQNQPACTDAALSSNLDGFNSPKPFDQIYPCHSALFNDAGNPRADMSTPYNFCYNHGPGCPTGASCQTAPDANTTLFCVCGAPITPAPTGPPTKPGLSPAPRVAPGFGAMVAALFLGMFTKSQHSFVASTLLLSLVPFASAHNWIEGTRGRAALLGANQFCSPTFPQINRNEIHMQVGVQQDFVVEWAAAHGDYTYFIVIPDSARDNASLLTRAVLDGYLAGCPGGGFANASGTTNMKYHRFRPNQNLASNEVVNTASVGGFTYAQTFVNSPIYSGTIWNSFSQNGQRPANFYDFPGSLIAAKTQSGDLYTLPFNASNYPSTCLAEYLPSFLLNDRRCSYVNASYPWIETVHRYQHSDVITAVATATLRIEARSGPGRYQVHYHWASYCDVMDVDVQATTILQPYGTAINATSVVFDVAQHCYFPSPIQVGQCIEVVTTVQQCEALCAADANCKAFQLSPLRMNQNASAGNAYGAFPDHSYIPWNVNTSWCDSTQFSQTPNTGSMICMMIIQFQNSLNSARPLWTFTQDMDHQGFYSTCYIKPRFVNFTNPLQLPVDVDMTYRFGSTCIPCDNLGMDPVNPRWGPQQEYCTDCTKAAPTPAATYTAPPNYQKLPDPNNNGTFTGASHWLSPGGTPYAQFDECRALAKRDPTCSSFIMFSQTRANKMSQGPKNYNVNTSFPLVSSSGGAYHYLDSSIDISYYRTCACLDLTAAPVAPAYPTIDSTQAALACDGVMAAQCVFRGFVVYQLL